MTKSEATKAAQEKANLSKQNQMVFSYASNVVCGSLCESQVVHDYTHESLWKRRHFRAPIATEVIVVTPDMTGQKNL